MSETDSGATAWLADHPRMLGVLFMITMLAAQAAPVLANGGMTNNGP